MTKRTVPTNLPDLARDLVIRARAGDQNAMGTLVEIGKGARAKSNPRIIQVYQLVEDYTKKHPYDGIPSLPLSSKDSTLSGEEANDYVSALREKIRTKNGEDFGCAIVTLGPIMGDYAIVTLCDELPLIGKSGNANITEIASMFGSEKEVKAFFLGLKNSHKAQALLAFAKRLKASTIKALGIGSLVGQAKRMQAVARTNAPISTLSRVAGWEHGE